MVIVDSHNDQDQFKYSVRFLSEPSRIRESFMSMRPDWAEPEKFCIAKWGTDIGCGWYRMNAQFFFRDEQMRIMFALRWYEET